HFNQPSVSDTAPWMWSGAGLANYTNVIGVGQNWLNYYKYGVWTRNGWYASSRIQSYPSFCFNLIVIDQKMSWEDALMYCRGQHTELTSLLSETETQLALGELKSANISERVWIGLRFLPDQWMWMSGESLNYTAWAHDGDFMDRHCPQRGRCGALNKEGAWEDWNCNEKLNFICY
uniref:C-type lectin domain-containing protein n=1 Tax=Neogobius melanostomus TaxID=47308 RepID=A0A8C6ST94_9GOBI